MALPLLALRTSDYYPAEARLCDPRFDPRYATPQAYAYVREKLHREEAYGAFQVDTLAGTPRATIYRRHGIAGFDVHMESVPGDSKDMHHCDTFGAAYWLATPPRS